MNLIPIEPVTEKIIRYQPLQAGQYWRSLVDLEHKHIDSGEVLLLESIKWVDDAPHTVEVRLHPSKCTRYNTTTLFLIKDFLVNFEFEPDAEILRANELKELLGSISQLQSELQDAQTNPLILQTIIEETLRAEAETQVADKTLPALAYAQTETEVSAQLAAGNLASAISSGLSIGKINEIKAVVNHEAKIATIKSQWISAKTTEIANTIAQMTPYYTEQAAAALAATEDTRVYVNNLLRGIETLDLYVGTGVDVKTIREGGNAPDDEPLTLMQRKLFMDEELVVWADVSERFDFWDQDKFYQALIDHDDLVEQIFPTQRCVVVMAVRRHTLDYGDGFVNMRNNAINTGVFILIRNGMNIYRVDSPITSHAHANRLFPSKNDQDKLFKGFDGRQIKFDDLQYTKSLAKHEIHAWHYKRFLILICGLDHRLQLFGRFYPGEASFKFVSLEFQEQYLRFVHDDDGDGMLPMQARPPIKDWMRGLNKNIQPGSRIITSNNIILTEHTAPGAFTNRGEQLYSSPAAFSLHKVLKRDNTLSASIEVTGYSYAKKQYRTFNCTVDLLEAHRTVEGIPFLCIDNISETDILDYINSRSARGDITSITFLKQALHFIRLEKQGEAFIREEILADSLTTGNHDFNTTLLDQLISRWHVTNKTKTVNELTVKPLKTALDYLKNKTSLVEAVTQYIETNALPALRFSMNGNAKLYLYVKPAEDERDDRLAPHNWVQRIEIVITGQTIKQTTSEWTTLHAEDAAEMILWESANSKEWSNLPNYFDSYGDKLTLFETAEKMIKTARSLFLDKPSKEESAELIEDWRDCRKKLFAKPGKRLIQANLFIPVAVLIDKTDSRVERSDFVADTSRLSLIGFYAERPENFLLGMAATPEEQAAIADEYAAHFADKERAKTRLLNQAKSKYLTINKVSIEVLNNPCRVGCFVAENAIYTDKNFSRITHSNSNDETSNDFKAWLEKLPQRKADIWFPENGLQTVLEILKGID